MLNRRSNVTLIVSTIILGGLVGAGAIVIGEFLDLIEALFLGFNESALQPTAILVTPIQRLLSLTLGGIIAAISWWALSTKMQPTVTISAAIKGEHLPWWSTILDVFTQIFYVGTGGSVGRELAPRQLGALIAQTLVQLLDKVRKVKVSDEDRQLFIAAAAGAGFAGIYIAPITGMLFSVEILLNKVTKRTVTVSLIMSTTAMMVGAITHGFHPYYLVGGSNFNSSVVWLVVVIAPICGIVGAYFRRLFKQAGAKRATGTTVLWQLPVVSLLVGGIAMAFPQIMGNGRALAALALQLHTSKMIVILLLGGLAKALVTPLTLKAGAAGGTLTPSISLGAVIGVIVGFVANLFFPGIAIWQAGVIGASALLATSQQAPLMALFMLFEICHLNYSAFLPLGVAVAVSVMVGNVILKQK